MPPRQVVLWSGVLVMGFLAFLLLLELASGPSEQRARESVELESDVPRDDAEATGSIETAPFVEPESQRPAQISAALPELADLHEIEEFRGASEAWAASSGVSMTGLKQPLHAVLAEDPPEARRILEVLASGLDDTSTLAELLLQEDGSPWAGFDREFVRFADDEQLIGALEAGAAGLLSEISLDRLKGLPPVDEPDELEGVAFPTLVRLVAQGCGAAATRAEQLLTKAVTANGLAGASALPRRGPMILAKVLSGGARARVFDVAMEREPSDGSVRRLLRVLRQPLTDQDPSPLLARLEAIGLKRERVRRDALHTWLVTSGWASSQAGKQLNELWRSYGSTALFKALMERPLLERLGWIDRLVTGRSEPFPMEDRGKLAGLLSRVITERFDHRARSEDFRIQDVDALLEQVATPPWGIAVDALDSLLQLATVSLLKSMGGEERGALLRGLEEMGIDGLADVLEQKPDLSMPVQELLSALAFLERFDADITRRALMAPELAEPEGARAVIAVLDRLAPVPTGRRKELGEPLRRLLREHRSSEVRCKALRLVLTDATTHEGIVAVLADTTNDRDDDLAGCVATGLLGAVQRGALTPPEVSALVVAELRRTDGHGLASFLNAMEEGLPQVLRSGKHGAQFRRLVSDAGSAIHLTGRAKRHFDRLLARLPAPSSGG